MAGRILNREVKVFTASTLSGTPQNFGTATAIPCYKVAFVNASTQDVQISDGTGQNNFYLPSGSTLSIGEGFQNNTPQINVQGEFKVGTQFMISSSTGLVGTGSIVATLLGTVE